MSYDLCIYGHLTVDRIFDGFTESSTLGAMANVWNTLTKIDNSLTVKLNPTSLGEAIILVNRNNAERVSKANLNIHTNQAKIVDAKWHHIMYLNKLHNCSFINSIEGIISADVTGGFVDENMECLDMLDYLFVSDEDLTTDVKKLAQKAKGKVILHYPSGSLVADKNGAFETKTKVLKDIDVLGAGDIFAACFISYMLRSYEIKEAIALSHDKTSQILMEKTK